MKRENRIKNEAAKRLANIVRSVMDADPAADTKIEEVVLARQMFYKVFRDTHKKWSFAKIGALIGRGYDHATVRHGMKIIEDLMSVDSRINSAYVQILTMFNNGDDEYEYVTREMVYKKIIETNDLIKQQNAYIADLKGQIEDLKGGSDAFSDLYEVIRMHTPKAKIEDAKKKVRAVLNGL